MKELAAEREHFLLLLTGKVKTRTLQNPKHAAPTSRPAAKGLPAACRKTTISNKKRANRKLTHYRLAGAQ
jgi:hypothetical protein